MCVGVFGPVSLTFHDGLARGGYTVMAHEAGRLCLSKPHARGLVAHFYIAFTGAVWGKPTWGLVDLGAR